MTIPVKSVTWGHRHLGDARTLTEAAHRAIVAGADVRPGNPHIGRHAIVEGPESFSIEARIAP